MADCAALGYLSEPVLDLTFGKGRFWGVHVPEVLIGTDLVAKSRRRRHGDLVVADFTCAPFADGVAGSVVFDPPYKLNGTPAEAADEPYGVDVVATRDERLSTVLAGIDEAARLARPGGYVLVKCQDQVNGGKKRWQVRLVENHVEALGLAQVDKLLVHSYRPQPAGRRQVTSRQDHSALVVARRP